MSMMQEQRRSVPVKRQPKPQAEHLAATGQFCWPPLGRSHWPLRLDDAYRPLQATNSWTSARCCAPRARAAATTDRGVLQVPVGVVEGLRSAGWTVTDAEVTYGVRSKWSNGRRGGIVVGRAFASIRVGCSGWFGRHTFALKSPPRPRGVRVHRIGGPGPARAAGVNAGERRGER